MNTEAEVDGGEVVSQDDAAEQAAYDAARGVAQEQEPQVAKVESEQQSEQEVATETPQTEPKAETAKDELTELRSQVEKMGDVFKRLDDVNGRYGRLSQRVEEMQQKIVAAPNTAAGVAANTADAKELMKDLRDEYPELAEKLEGAFSKVMSSKGSIDPEAISKAVAEMRAAEVKVETESLEAQLDELHPGWEKVTGSQAKGIDASEKFVEWMQTLPKREMNRLNATRDPFYLAEMIEKHNEWLAKPSEVTPQPQPKPANQANKKRLADAVMPKGANASLSATQISEQEAYDKARAEARRIKK